MQEHDNMVTSQNTTTTKFKNISFVCLEEEFAKHNWLLEINEADHIVFKSPTSDYNYYEIYVDKNKINVSIPLKNSTYKYKTSFNSYFEACEYIEMQFNDFISTL